MGGIGFPEEPPVMEPAIVDPGQAAGGEDDGGDRPTAEGGPTGPERQELIDFIHDLQEKLTVISGFLGDLFPLFEQGLPGLRAGVALAVAQLRQEAIAGQLAAADLLDGPLAMKLSVRSAARGRTRPLREFGKALIGATKISLKAANVLLGVC